MMMLSIFPYLATAALCACAFFADGTVGAPEKTAPSVHDFTVKDIDGKDVALSNYKGGVMLIVNVASK